MALSDRGRLRLYLRDKDGTFFSDDEIQQLLDEESSVEAAAALGWLLKGATAADTPTTITIGQMSETKGQATESWKVAMAMHHYWSRKAGEPVVGTGRWLEVQPDSGIVADLLDTVKLIEDYWADNDISRLIAVT